MPDLTPQPDLTPLAPQPSARYCFVCGVANPHGLRVRFFETPAGGIQADVVLSEAYQSYSGIVHGGIVATLLDEAASRVYFRGDPPRLMVTAKLSVRYRKPVPVGQPLRLVGRPLSDKGKICNAAAELYDADGTLLAECEALLVQVEADYMEQFAPLDGQGWQVYEED